MSWDENACASSSANAQTPVSFFLEVRQLDRQAEAERQKNNM